MITYGKRSSRLQYPTPLRRSNDKPLSKDDEENEDPMAEHIYVNSEDSSNNTTKGHNIHQECIPCTPRRSPRKRLLMESVEILTPRKRSKIAESAYPSPLPSPAKKQKAVRRGLLPEIDPTGVSNTCHLSPDERPRGSSTGGRLLSNANLVPQQTSGSSGPYEIEEMSLAVDADQPQRSYESINVQHGFYQSYLLAQKKAVLAAIESSFSLVAFTDDDDCESCANALTLKQLSSLLKGVTERGEGNSCLIVGPRGSGKSEVFERAVSSLESQPIVIRLSGYVQRNDRMAIREITRQISEQIDKENSFAIEAAAEELRITSSDKDTEPKHAPVSAEISSITHLSSFISTLSRLSRSVVVLLDAFDLFTTHPRQALLYCLLDAVQSGRYSITSTTSSLPGIGIIGLTSRVDVMNLLEKRVKSRFSHRVFRTSAMQHVDDWIALLGHCLRATIKSALHKAEDNHEGAKAGGKEAEWSKLWFSSIDKLLKDKDTVQLLNETFGITKDVRVPLRALACMMSALDPAESELSVELFRRHISDQRCIQRLPSQQSLSYPGLCLLVAAQHARVSGQEVFNFEMLHTSFRNEVRTSAAAPVLVGGTGIGMLNVSKGVLWIEFEHLCRCGIFRPAESSSASARQFWKYRCTLMPEEVKGTVERSGLTNLRKWLNKR